ncbi:MAG: hypothetical protein HYY06_26900 [Deltaproteobacteria bacterium]|nr:hypothetical protein [Deltaproteobacteria bacterium]
MRSSLVVLLVLAGCDSAPYHSQIGEIEGPDSIAEPAAHGQSHWRTSHVGSATLRAVTCAGDSALAVGDRGTVVRLAPSGEATVEAPLSIDLHALAVGPHGAIVGGAGALFERRGLGAWKRTALPREKAHVRSIAVVGEDSLVVGGLLESPAGSVGWAAERSADAWTERRLELAPAVFQVLRTRSGKVLLVLDSTPLLWSHRDLLVQLLPAQDVHPRILAMDETPRGFVAVGIDTAWTIENGRLIRELRQLQMRLTGVAAAPPSGAVAVGRASPPGGRPGGVAWYREPGGAWRRELLVPDELLIAVARCGPRVIAVGERGLVAIRE